MLLPALLFALAHGAQDAPIFVDRFAFGLVAGVLVITTGGLEAGIAMHVLNNFLAFGLALAYSDMTSALNPHGRQLVAAPGDPHPVARLPRPRDLGRATRVGIATGPPDPAGFGGPRAARVRFRLGLEPSETGPAGQTPVRQWDMV